MIYSNFYIYLINIFILFALILIKSGNTYILNGLPFNNANEIIFILIFFPLIFYYHSLFFLKKIFLFLLLATLSLKLILFFSPQLGLKLKQQVYGSEIFNYEQIWNNGYAIQDKNYLNRNYFPLEWSNYYDKNNNVETRDSSILFDYKDTQIKYIVSGYLTLNNDEIFIVETSGKISENSFLRNINNDKKSNLVDYLKNKDKLKSFDNQEYSSIEYEIYFEINFESFNKNSFLKYFIIKDEVYINPFQDNKLRTENITNKYFFSTISIFYHLMIFTLLSYIIFCVFKNYSFKTKHFNKYNILFIISLFFSILIFYNLYDNLNNLFTNLLDTKYKKIIKNIFDKDLIFSVYFFFILIFITLLKVVKINVKIKNTIIFNNFNKNTYFAFFILFPLFFFIINNFEQINNFSIHEKGNDWFVFQYFARQIAIFGDWIKGGEEIIYYRPLSRYLFAIIHIIFGQSLFSQNLIEIWCICISVYLFGLILKNYTNTTNLIYLFSSLILFLYFTDSFKIIIGRGLSEYYALLPIAIIGYYFSIYKIENIKYFKLLFIGLVGIIGILFREDHLFIIASLIVLSLNINGRSLKDFYINTIIEVKNNLKKIIFYFFVILLSFLIIYLRNYYATGLFNYEHYNLSGHKLKYFEMVFENLYLIISGNNYPGIFRIFSVFNLLALFLVFYLLFFNKVKSILSFKMSLIILAILLPYFYVAIWGYPPRYSIHLIPFSLLLIFIFAYDYNKFYIKNEK